MRRAGVAVPEKNGDGLNRPAPGAYSSSGDGDQSELRHALSAVESASALLVLEAACEFGQEAQVSSAMRNQFSMAQAARRECAQGAGGAVGAEGAAAATGAGGAIGMTTSTGHLRPRGHGPHGVIDMITAKCEQVYDGAAASFTGASAMAMSTADGESGGPKPVRWMTRPLPYVKI